MKKLTLFLAAVLLVSASVQSQEVEPPVVAISAQHFVFTPDEVRVRRGEPVTLRVTSTDRIHHLYSRELGFNVDVRPNQPRDITFFPAKAGRYVAIADTGNGVTQFAIDVE